MKLVISPLYFDFSKEKELSLLHFLFTTTLVVGKTYERVTVISGKKLLMLGRMHLGEREGCPGSFYPPSKESFTFVIIRGEHI